MATLFMYAVIQKN